MTSTRLSIHDRLTELADATRCRLLGALERQELTVGELCSALLLPQSTVSRHLRILADEAWVTSRADGPTRWYRMSADLDDEARALWALVREPTGATAAAVQDAARIDAVLAARRTRSEAFFATTGAEWDAMRTSLFGVRADLTAALALLDPTLVVGDLGCGTGELSAALAPHVAHVHAVDASPAMLAAARARVGTAGNVTVVEGTLEALPLPDASLDVAVLLLVLHHVADPARALAEVRRVLKPRGRVMIADMRAHTHEEYRVQMGHVWLGFDAGALVSWLEHGGFRDIRFVPLPVDPAATGPALFTVTATREVEK
ncbi:MAG TPA: metalloregulator ArsR/SmtB family transcription factor [Gemmatimonas sp.]|nr:metalloregulator ArsR/SmtB family transcription factor [Gemmatimonas sp.]